MTKPLVLLHGWGCDSRTWQPLLPALQTQLSEWKIITIDLPGFGGAQSEHEFALPQVLESLAQQIPDGSVLMGWSLGAMLAVQLAAHYPQKVAGLISLAANAQFVAAPDYPTAMAREVNESFNNQFAAQPAFTLKLFTGLLAQGDSNERALLKQLRPVMDADAIKPNWHAALLLLSTLDNRAVLAIFTKPCLHLLAENDVLVPIAAAKALARINPQHRVVTLPGVAHALHWSQPAQVMQHLENFLREEFPVAAIIDKKKIAQSFGRAASHYDAIAHFQRKLGQQLAELLPVKSAACVLDLGCGTGAFAAPLQAQYPQALYVACDISEAMLQHAQAHLLVDGVALAGDAENLPLADESVDVIFSNLVLQWCGDIPALWQELSRVLKPGGQIIFSTLVERSLCELKAAWAQVDEKVHVNHFASADEWKNHLSPSLVIQQSHHFIHREWFDDVSTLTRSIKGIGARNLNAGRPQGLSGRQRIHAFKQAYEQFREQQQLPLTYDVLFIRAQKRESHE